MGDFTGGDNGSDDNDEKKKQSEEKQNRLDSLSDRGIVPGTGYLHSNYPIWFRVIWVLIIVTMLGMMLYQVADILISYKDDPIDLDITYEYPDRLPYPNLLICPTEQIKLSKLYQKYGYDFWRLFSQNNPTAASSGEFPSSQNNVSDRKAWDAAIRQRNDVEEYVRENRGKLFDLYPQLTIITERLNLSAVFPDALRVLGPEWTPQHIRDQLHFLINNTIHSKITEELDRYGLMASEVTQIPPLDLPPPPTPHTGGSTSRKKRAVMTYDPLDIFVHEIDLLYREMMMEKDPNEYRLFLGEVSSTLDESIVSCRQTNLGQDVSCRDLFREEWTIFGRCFVMDASRIEAQDTSILNGLRLRLHSHKHDDSRLSAARSTDFQVWMYEDWAADLPLSRPMAFSTGTDVTLPIRKNRAKSKGVDCNSDTAAYSRLRCVLDKYAEQTEADCGCRPSFVGGTDDQNGSSKKCQSFTEIFCASGTRSGRLGEISDQCQNPCEFSSFNTVPQYSNGGAARNMKTNSGGETNETWIAARDVELKNVRRQFARLPRSYLDELRTANDWTSFSALQTLKKAVIDPAQDFVQRADRLNGFHYANFGGPDFEGLYVGPRSSLPLIKTITDYSNHLYVNGGLVWKTATKIPTSPGYFEALMDFPFLSNQIKTDLAGEFLLLPNGPSNSTLFCQLPPVMTFFDTANLYESVSAALSRADPNYTMPIDVQLYERLRFLAENCSLPCPPTVTDKTFTAEKETETDDVLMSFPLDLEHACARCPQCFENTELQAFDSFQTALDNHVSCYNYFVIQFPVFLHLIEELRMEISKTMPALMEDPKRAYSFSSSTEEPSSLEKLASRQLLPNITSGIFASYDIMARLRDSVLRIDSLTRQAKYVASRFTWGMYACGFDDEEMEEIRLLADFSGYELDLDSEASRRTRQTFLDSIENFSKLKKTTGEAYLNENTLSITLYYSDMVVEVVSKSLAYSFWKMLSDIGGAMGLYFGCCVVSILELIFMCTRSEEKLKQRQTPKERFRSQVIQAASINRQERQQEPFGIRPSSGNAIVPPRTAF